MSIKKDILEFLGGREGWTFGGTIEDYIRAVDKHKASNASRRCRELYQDGKIDRQEVKVAGVCNKVVQYKIIREVKQLSLL